MKFYDDVKHLLDKRKDGFDIIFDYLKKIENPLIVETGCAREEENYLDGQSSLLFDKYIHEYGGEFYTVDIAQQSVNFCKNKMISLNSHVTMGDSIEYLKQLNQDFQNQNKKIDFLYLDSYDAPRDDPRVVFESSLHHFYEFTCILRSLKPGALLAVDDNWIEQKDEQYVIGGKGQMIFEYMMKTGNPPIHTGYQFMWTIQ